jgi:hypothetical protein
MSPSDDDPGTANAQPTLFLLKSEAVTRPRQRPQDQSDDSRLRLIDCRPDLLKLLRRARPRTPVLEIAERLLGRFAALAAAKLRR